MSNAVQPSHRLPYAFFVQRPRDYEAWPLLFRDRAPFGTLFTPQGVPNSGKVA
jgi:hypothetical protein